MNKIKILKKDLNLSLLNKKKFIDEMHLLHSTLFSYSNEIDKTDIQTIKINSEGVFFILNNNLTFQVNDLDKRTAPIEAFNFNNYESDYSDLLLKTSKKATIILDIGANVGWYSLHFSKMKSSKIYSFEPVEYIFNQLKNNIQLNNISNVFPFNVALSNETGNKEFYYDPLNASATSSENILDSVLAPITCRTIDLDTFIVQNKIERLDLIKCDVEGAEINVIKGGLNSIKKFRPIVFMEMLRKWSAKFNYHPNDIIQLFNLIGYSCYEYINKELIKIENIDEDTISTNFLFLHNTEHHEFLKTYNEL